jgi:hypothetical protein
MKKQLSSMSLYEDLKISDMLFTAQNTKKGAISLISVFFYAIWYIAE